MSNRLRQRHLKNKKSDSENAQKGYAKAIALFQQKAFDQALLLTTQLLEKTPQDDNILNLHGILLAQHKRFDEAFTVWEKLLEKNPQNADILANLGLARRHSGHLQEARHYLEQALAVQPQHLNAILNMGVVLQELNHFQEALNHYYKVVELSPNNLQALFNIGVTEQHRFNFTAAHATYQKVLALDPNHPGAQANLIFTQHYLYPAQPALISAKARKLGQQFCASVSQLPLTGRHFEPDRPLRLGFLSADLRDHPVGYFLESLLSDTAAREHDWFAYHNNHVETALTARLKPLFTTWRTVFTMADDDLAARIQADQVDILIDLSGYTAGHRLAVFARRPAPMQLSWLGYFGTTGLPTMDGVIADPICVPTHEKEWFTEIIHTLPHSRFCFAPPTKAPAVAPLPALHNDYITFGSYQELAKINDRVLALWKTILEQCPEARLRIQSQRLKTGSSDLISFQARLEKLGMDMTRISLYGPTPRQDYLASYSEVDLLLDTFPYPGGTTTTEALWMGVPTISLTLPGMLGRQGEGLLHASGLMEWAVQSEQEYLDKALYWSAPTNRPALANLRAEMRQTISHAPLFDAARFAHDWLQLIRRLWREKCSDIAEQSPL